MNASTPLAMAGASDSRSKSLVDSCETDTPGVMQRGGVHASSGGGTVKRCTSPTGGRIGGIGLQGRL